MMASPFLDLAHATRVGAPTVSRRSCWGRASQALRYRRDELWVRYQSAICCDNVSQPADSVEISKSEAC